MIGAVAPAVVQLFMLVHQGGFGRSSANGVHRCNHAPGGLNLGTSLAASLRASEAASGSGAYFRSVLADERKRLERRQTGFPVCLNLEMKMVNDFRSLPT
jgi:hypothetical protein